MSLELLRVRLDDIYPLEDVYGNLIASRDYSLQVNADYVARLAKSFGESGGSR